MAELRALILFFPLAFLLSWYPYILGKTHLVKTSGGINPLGPMVAALIVASICYGKTGVKELLGRYTRWRIGWGPLTLALLLPVVIPFVAAAVNIAAGATRPVVSQLAGWPELIPSSSLFCYSLAWARRRAGVASPCRSFRSACRRWWPAWCSARSGQRGTSRCSEWNSSRQWFPGSFCAFFQAR